MEVAIPCIFFLSQCIRPKNAGTLPRFLKLHCAARPKFKVVFFCFFLKYKSILIFILARWFVHTSTVLLYWAAPYYRLRA